MARIHAALVVPLSLLTFAISPVGATGAGDDACGAKVCRIDGACVVFSVCDDGCGPTDALCWTVVDAGSGTPQTLHVTWSSGIASGGKNCQFLGSTPLVCAQAFGGVEVDDASNGPAVASLGSAVICGRVWMNGWGSILAGGGIVQDVGRANGYFAPGPSQCTIPASGYECWIGATETGYQHLVAGSDCLDVVVTTTGTLGQWQDAVNVRC